MTKFLNYLVFFIVIVSLPIARAQGSKSGKDQSSKLNASIRWVRQFSTQENLLQKKSFKDKILQAIWGKKSWVLDRPFAIYSMDQYNWTILDQGAKRVIQVQTFNGKLSKVDENGFQLQSPVAICSGPEDQLYFTDSGLNQIFKIDEASNKITLLNKELVLNQPTGIAFCKTTGDFWVVETKAHKITILNSTGHKIRSIGKRGTKPGEFNFPTFLWLDDQDKLYIVDSMNFRVQILDIQGNPIQVFGEQGDASGYFARSKGIATDSFGNIYIVDALFHTIQIFDQDGNFLYNFGEQGKEPGQFWLPAGIFIDENDFVYIADTYNARIQVFQLDIGNQRED